MYAASGVPKAFELFRNFLRHCAFAQTCVQGVALNVLAVSAYGKLQVGQVKLATGSLFSQAYYNAPTADCTPPTRWHYSITRVETLETSKVVLGHVGAETGVWIWWPVWPEPTITNACLYWFLRIPRINVWSYTYSTWQEASVGDALGSFCAGLAYSASPKASNERHTDNISCSEVHCARRAPN